MREDTPSPEKKKTKAIAYFLVAGGLLIMLAFVWSIDVSINYMLLGAITFLVFLGFWNWPWAIRSTRYDQGYQRPAGTSDQRTYQAQSQSRPTPKPAPDQRKTRILLVIVPVFLFSIFLVIILAVVIRRADPQPEYDYLFAADQYYGTGQYDSAYVNYKRALRANPEHAEALLGLGNTFSELGNPDSALIMYDQALAANPDMDAARYNKGWVHYKNKNYAEAERELVALLEKNPSYLDAMLTLGNVFYDQTRYDEALKWYEGAYTNGMRGNWICHVMGFLYQTKGDNNRAIALYKEALTYDSTVLDIYQRLGEIVPGEEGQRYRRRGAGQQW